MKQFLSMASFVIDNYIDRMGKVVSWLTTLLMIVICIDVVMRYLFSATETWILELEWHLFAVLFLLGASYALLHNKHVRVDVFYEKFSSKRRNLVNALGVVLFLLPWGWVIVTNGWDYMSNSWAWGEGSPQPTGLPARWFVKSMIVIGFGLLMIQGISELIKATVGGGIKK
jgi:TRAP-type mannitol/chloroaromatic compound transport system permease small subunit